MRYLLITFFLVSFCFSATNETLHKRDLNLQGLQNFISPKTQYSLFEVAHGHILDFAISSANLVGFISKHEINPQTALALINSDEAKRFFKNAVILADFLLKKAFGFILQYFRPGIYNIFSKIYTEIKID